MNVPDPWAVAGAILDLRLIRLPIDDCGRYYHEHRTIVLRTALPLAHERAVLWHELVHAERGDFRCLDGVLDAQQEQSVDREAARRAMPWPVLRWGIDTAVSDHDLVDRMKVDERLVRVRFDSMHPSERAYAARRRVELQESA